MSESTAFPDPWPEALDADRRFASLSRLYGPRAQDRLAGSHIVVAGIGGVGSWTAEALARSGVGALTLIDLDHIAESNVNRQVHALSSTLGQAKVHAMGERIRQIHPHCRLTLIDDFVAPDNVARYLTGPYTAIVDGVDQAQAKIAMILHARATRTPLVLCGGAGGKTDVLALRGGDLSEARNDALLAKLRNTLRRLHQFSKASDAAGKPKKRIPKMGIRALWFDQSAIRPELWRQNEIAFNAADAIPAFGGAAPQGLSCAGYGSVVTVTATMGMAAAQEALAWVLRQADIEPAA